MDLWKSSRSNSQLTGGSIMHQITAFGGLAGKAPFQQAVLQSAAFQNVSDSEEQQQTRPATADSYSSDTR